MQSFGLNHKMVVAFMGVGRISSRGGNGGFFQGVAKKILSKGANSGENSFYRFETKRITFFLLSRK